MKKRFTLVLLVTLLSFSLSIVFAQQNEKKMTYSEKPTIGIQSKKPNVGEGFVAPDSLPTPNLFQLESTTGELQGGSCSIRKTSSTSVEGYGKTVATAKVDKLGYTLYFQVWSGSEWVNIDNVKNSANNAQVIFEYHNENVITGKYYRVKVKHFVTDDGQTTTATSYSDYILVD